MSRSIRAWRKGKPYLGARDYDESGFRDHRQHRPRFFRRAAHAFDEFESRTNRNRKPLFKDHRRLYLDRSALLRDFVGYPFERADEECYVCDTRGQFDPCDR